MGSAVLGEAISAIRDWSMAEARSRGGARAAEAFGSLVFNDAVQQKRLPEAGLSRAAADHRRTARRSIRRSPTRSPRRMKDWAVEHGATHYTHWFQPLTGITAEKHDSFLSPDRRTARRSRSSPARS